ncbi:hypothetical protein HAX54_038032 [Datura stramonium]|uniref:Uncharacterized protein n=1 Tax=Datura stramonium TaxID=4076 RepID=A0ABS8SHV4_DATST|nr:hypothetical protein [Datura stramonium]
MDKLTKLMKIEVKNESYESIPHDACTGDVGGYRFENHGLSAPLHALQLQSTGSRIMLSVLQKNYANVPSLPKDKKAFCCCPLLPILGEGDWPLLMATKGYLKVVWMLHPMKAKPNKLARFCKQLRIICGCYHYDS